MTIKEIQEILKPYRKELSSLVSKSDESFEKQLSYISSGALALSFLLVEKVIVDVATSHGKWILVLGWTSLTCSLIVNLLSHRVASKCHGKSIAEIDATFKLKDGYEGDYPVDCFDSARAEKRKGSIRIYNSWSIWLLFAGIALIILYSALNLFDENRGDSKKDPITIVNNIYPLSLMAEKDSNKLKQQPLNEGRQGSLAPITLPSEEKRGLERTPVPKVPVKPKSKKN